jgi:alkanesulfonate monooxygenase SsuD/methylene tetrahydromethanopterin reductase-like flavin-dependent oxidoreductase (luciferase family)
MLGVAVMCAATHDHARWLAGPSSLAFARLRQGRPGLYPTPEEAAEHVFTPFERELLRSWRASQLVGDPDHVLDGLAELARRTGADELMITTMAHGYEDRRRSYELVAEVAQLEPAAPLING